MFLEDTDNDRRKFDNKALTFFQKNGGTFLSALTFWRENLFERIMRLFVWSNTEPVPAKEIEQRLLIQGHCGVFNFKDPSTGITELTAMFGNFFGVGKYIDEKPGYTMRCPVWSGSTKVGVNSVVISNNSLKNSALPLVDHYAFLLAHADVTLSRAMIEARDAGGVPVATSDKQKADMVAYNKKRYNGEDGVIIDFGALGVQYAGADRHTSQNIVDIMDVRQRILKSFYADIGVRASFEKRSNSTTSEVQADTSMLLLNIADMIEYRKKGAEAVNAMFNTNWQVEIAPEINYDGAPYNDKSEEGMKEDETIIS
jgi:hypothetical protein